MYSFKIKEAEEAISEYLRRHPNSKVAGKALDGDCAAMMELYEKLCGSREFDGGPVGEALSIIYEAYNRKYPPAMIRLAQVEMCDDIKYWPEGVMVLMEAYKLGSQDAMTQLKNEWHNSVMDIETQYRGGEQINQYEEFILAFYYYYGISTPKNEALALRLLQSSTKQGCAEAANMLRNIQIGHDDGEAINEMPCDIE